MNEKNRIEITTTTNDPIRTLHELTQLLKAEILKRSANN